MAKDLGLISREVFYFFSGLLIISIILEVIWPNIILAYFNINYIFSAAFISGLISLTKK